MTNNQKFTAIDLQDKRQEYIASSLNISSISDDPFDQFAQWYLQIEEVNGIEANAMTLSTVSSAGRPSSRIILLKEVTEKGFVFYTNYQSRKAKDMEANGYISLSSFWPTLERQVRIEGRVEKYDPEKSTAYFQSRPRGSQIGAWASPQSEAIQDREWLERQVDRREVEFAGKKKLPRPPYWGGYLCIPDYFEFWQGRVSRLHDRIVYTYEDGNWLIKRLAP